ncbi:MAG: DUF6261 family protein [Paludibacter sp.]|nr:DUF6261 family protein [Paludibacter sp.]
MKVTIFRVQLSHLWNSEYCMFVSQIVAIFLKFGAEALHLKKSFDRVQALMPEIVKIKAQELGNVISNQLADLNTERRTLIVSISDQVKMFGKLSMPSLAQQVVIMNRFLDKHGRDIGNTNYNSNTDRFNDLLIDYDANTEVKAAAAAMLLVILFDHLQEINTQFATLYLQRSDENSSVEKVDAEAIRAEMDKTLTAFYDAFEFCSTEYEDLDYQTPADKMNELITHYKTQLKARETRRHEGKDVHTEDPITAPA